MFIDLDEVSPNNVTTSDTVGLVHTLRDTQAFFDLIKDTWLFGSPLEKPSNYQTKEKDEQVEDHVSHESISK